jgi:hypothetical protein
MDPEDFWLDAAVAEAGERMTDKILDSINFNCGHEQDFGISYLVNLLRIIARGR